MVMDKRVVYSAVRIIGDQDSTTYPYQSERQPIGTGFMVHVESETGPHVHGYLVTTAHVIEGQENIEMQPTRGDGTLCEVLIPVTDWRIPDPNLDVAISPILDPPPEGEPYWALPLSLVIPVGRVT